MKSLTASILAFTALISTGFSVQPIEMEFNLLENALAQYPTTVQQDMSHALSPHGSRGTFQAFSGGNCDGATGDHVGFTETSSCVPTQGRHSFRLSGCSGSAAVWTNSDCHTGTFKVIDAKDGACYNVDTGLNWGSASVECV